VTAETSLENMDDMARQQMLSWEPFLHTAVYIERAAATREQLLTLQAEVEAELSRAKLTVDKLYLCQQEGSSRYSRRGATASASSWRTETALI